MSHKIRVTSLLSSENISVWHKLNQRPGRDTGPSRPSSAEVKNRVLSLRASVAYERVKPTYILNQIRHSSITTLCLLSGFTTGTNSKLQHSVVWGHVVWWTGTACLNKEANGSFPHFTYCRTLPTKVQNIRPRTADITFPVQTAQALRKILSTKLHGVTSCITIQHSPPASVIAINKH